MKFREQPTAASSSSRAYFMDQAELFGKVDWGNIPRHIGIIMDGNGRWARRRGWKRVLGHEHARESVREAVYSAGELGVSVLSLFAFSTENWQRPREEVEFLFHLFDRTLKEEIGGLKKNNVQLNCTGDPVQFPQWLARTFEESFKALDGNSGLILNLAVNYGGRQDILQAVNALIEERAGRLEVPVDEKEFEAHLMTKEMPSLDLMVRTSGERRISNFFLWQAAYAELVFLPVLWPDFRRQQMLEAVLEFQSRERRMGAVGQAA